MVTVGLTSVLTVPEIQFGELNTVLSVTDSHGDRGLAEMQAGEFPLSGLEHPGGRNILVR